LGAQPSIYSDAPAKFGQPNYSLAELARQQEEVITLQKERSRHAEVTVVAPVSRILPDDTQGLQHERFIISLTNGTTILIAHDTSYAPRVPVQLGDAVRIHGEYIWNQRGGLIHWTHASDSPFHEGGWIDYQGRRYQ
jgi:hypothetical protein